MKYIWLLKIGVIPESITRVFKKELPNVFQLKVKELPAWDTPEFCYDMKRKQYWSSLILKKMGRMIDVTDGKVLAITEVDIYASDLNFVFGEAELAGRNCIISTYRLTYGIRGEIVENPVFLKRTFKEGVHELGHTFGLRHCPNPKCIMHFSNSLADTDYKDSDYCTQCNKLLKYGKQGFYRDKQLQL